MKYLLALFAVACWCLTAASGNKDLVFTDKEKQQLVKLRQMVKDVKADSWLTDDWSLIHYLRRWSGDVKAAADGVKETATWRRENNMDSILKEKILDLNPPFDTKSRAKDGSPLMIWLPARWDIRKQLLAGNRDKMIRYFDQMCESAHTVIRKDQAAGRNTTQWVQILDLHNYNLRQHACVTCFPLYYEVRAFFAF